MEDLRDDSEARKEVLKGLKEINVLQTVNGEVIVGHGMKTEESGEMSLQNPVYLIIKGRELYFQNFLGRPNSVYFDCGLVYNYKADNIDMIKKYLSVVLQSSFIKEVHNKIMM